MRHAASGSHRPDRPRPEVGRGARTVAAVSATAALTVLASLSIWAVLPALAGWHVNVVMSGSMAPALEPGDIVLSEPVEASSLAAGQVALFEATDGRVLVHRVRTVAPDGSLTTRGDANPDDDVAPVRATQVMGLARLRVPWIGLPAVWLDEGHWLPLATTASLTAMAVAAVASEGEGPRTGRHTAGARRLTAILG